MVAISVNDQFFKNNSTASGDEVWLSSTVLSDTVRQSDLLVPDMHCGACLRNIEKGLLQVDGVQHARVNLGNKTVRVQWLSKIGPEPILGALHKLGFTVRVTADNTNQKDTVMGSYISALAVAGFAAANIMLFSVSVWAGAEPSTRILFHWLSALIAVPALIFSARIFYLSAWRALCARHTNMDVPITIGITLTCVLGIYDTATNGQQVYFEASVMLVFFLLIGRTLDHMMRQKACKAVDSLARLEAPGANRVDVHGAQSYISIDAIKSGDLLLVNAGERIPLDSWVERGSSEIDCSLINGESVPEYAGVGTELHAGTLNLMSPLYVRVTATAEHSFLSRIRRMVEEAELGQSEYQRLADKAARFYAPVVHSLAAISFIIWMLLSADLHRAATIAVAVLIITCPCAIGLAVPMVHVVASRRLFERGILVKNGVALERLVNVDTVVFDKTGTLTGTHPRLSTDNLIPFKYLELSAHLAEHSQHPFANAVRLAYRERLMSDKGSLAKSNFEFTDITELPGRGIEATFKSGRIRFGRKRWATEQAEFEDSEDTDHTPHSLASAAQAPGHHSQSVLTRNGEVLAQFNFVEEPKSDAKQCVDSLHHQAMDSHLLSGDNNQRVNLLASELGIEKAAGEVPPAEKAVYIKNLKQQGHSVLMIGDGLNDTIAMTEADVSMAPGSATDTGRRAADIVFLHSALLSIPETLLLARQAHRLIRQNFIIAIIYNLIALPFAMVGLITPLIAAAAMSLSSLIVVANALRLRTNQPPRTIQKLHQVSPAL